MSAPKGFTLIELLIIVSLITILSVIGMTVFGNMQKAPRDTRRKADINAIAKVLEVNRVTTGYPALSGTFFTSGNIPFDPQESRPNEASQKGCGNPAINDNYSDRCWYCYKSSGQVGICGPSDYWLTDNRAGSSWTICANLEATPGYYCRTNQQ
ncbi:type II secretion system protein [Candidatus Daviesbacteria bacterium]|nr:type II secretion system protein [Candidatus Daviesbacteria bacterium]